MDKTDLLEAQIEDKFELADSRNTSTYTSFLSLGDQEVFFNILRKSGYDPNFNYYKDHEFLLYGGKDYCDRKILFILPSYITKEDLISNIQNGEYIKVIKITPKNMKFSDTLNHRDFLGALMNLGLKREEFGDIFVKENIGYVIVSERSSNFVLDNLTKIKRTDVCTSLVLLKDFDLNLEFEDIYINVANNRLDAIVAEVFHLSRGKAQEFIEKELVYVNDEIKTNSALQLKENSRISVRGKGKFKFLELENKTRKNRLIIHVQKYK